jgi:hypothetical protein
MMAGAMDRSTTSARAARLLDDAASRSRSGARSRVDTLRVVARRSPRPRWPPRWPGLAGTELIGHEAPFLAPIAAIITLGTTYGQRTRRAVEIAIASRSACSSPSSWSCPWARARCRSPSSSPWR